MGAGVTARELVLENFKSFGVKTRIPLRSGFTTISGPNGSGKSNLLDSLLFVLGLSSSKQLRAERLPDLITNQKGKTHARVALRLSIPEDDGTERILEIARAVRITRAGYVSTYYLDGSPVALSRVHDRLNELGIGSQGGNVVLQGDVTRIITMSPLERRRLIDELAGVAEFDRKIDQAQGEIAKADRHMEDCRLISSELSQRLETLSEERAQALEHKRLEAERHEWEIQVLRAEVRELERKLEGLANDEEELVENQIEAREELPRIAEQIEKARQRLAEIEEDLRRIGEGEKLEKLRTLEELKARAASARAEVHHAEGLLREGERRARSLGSGIERARGDRGEAEGAGQEALRSAAQEEQAAEESAGELASARQRLDAIAAEARSKVEELHEQKDLARERRSAVEAARIRAENARENKERAGSRLGRLDGELEELAGKLKGLHELVDDADLTRAELETRTQDSAELLSALKHRRQELTDRKSDLEDEIRPLIRRVGAAEASSKREDSQALQVLRDEGIPGVVGEVASLLSFPDELGPAIEASSGARLRQIVVTDDKVAAECIRLLRAQKGHRTTFLPLNKIRGRSVTSFLDEPGLEDYLIQRVQFEERYLPAMEYVFGTTALARDLDSARRYLGRHRMVTRDGDLLDLSGAMSGGGSRKFRRGADDLGRLRKQLSSKEGEVRRLLDELQTVERRIVQAEQNRDRARQSLSDMDRDLARDRQDRDALLDQRVKLKTQREEIVAEVEELAGALEAATREEGRLGGELATVEERVKALEEELAGGEAARLGELLEQLSAALEEHRGKAREAREEAGRRELEMGYLDRSIEGWEKELAEVREREQELRDRVDQGRKQASRLEEEVSVLSEELEGLSSELEALRQEREKRSKALEGLFTRRASAEARITVLEEQLAGTREKIQELERARQEFARQLEEAGGVPEGMEEPPSLARCRKQLEEVARALEELGPVNLLAVEQYERLEGRRKELEERLEVLESEKQELQERIEHFGDLKREAFLEAFQAVDGHFRGIYAELSEGAGELELEKPEDPFAGGLTLRAQPLNKPMERLEALSGGEKSLAALAFIFSLQGFRPAPFYVFDEVDMFLDGRNTERLAEMIQRRAQGTQFLVVSLRKAMLRRSFRTIGVMPGPGGNTKVTGFEFEERAANA